MYRNVKRWWNRLSTIEKIGVGLGVWYFWNYISGIIGGLKASAAGKAAQLTDQATANNFGITERERVAIIRGYAADCQKATWDWRYQWPFGWRKAYFEDEEKVISIINGLKNIGEAKYLATAFVEAYPVELPQSDKVSLKTTIDKLFSASERGRIKSAYYAALS